MENHRIPVIQVIDSLALGGAESMAVKIANSLPEDEFESHLCVTRTRGPLETKIAAHVHVLYLGREHRFDWRPINRLSNYVRENKIQIVHAHSSSLFIARFVKLVCPSCKVLWHVHYGRYATVERSELLYRAATHRVDGVIAVNEPLAKWAIERLRVPAKRVWYLPNFAEIPDTTLAFPDLPGRKGFRIVCVAQFRPEKDHLTLLRAFYQVVQRYNEAHLLLIGGIGSDDYYDSVQTTIDKLSLREHVSFLGQRTDVTQLLRDCDIGVLSSASEGLPLALLEYGAAGLVPVVTDVGQCRSVLNGGNFGNIVAAGDSAALAQALIELLADSKRRLDLGRKFKEHVRAHYSRESVIKKLTDIYVQVL